MNKNKQQIKKERIEGLQRLPNASSQKIDVLSFLVDVLYGEPWTKEQFDALPKPERQRLAQLFTIGINYLGNEDRDHFLQQIAPIITPETRRQLWETNHHRILMALSKLTQTAGKFPSRRDIADETGLSRLTINKHLKEYFDSPEYIERQEDYALMRERVLARVFQFALDGNVKAARLFLDATATQQPVTNIRNQQNNFLQINGLTVTQEQIRELPADKQNVITELLMNLKTTK